LAAELGLFDNLNVGFSAEHTHDNDRHGNKSNGKSTLSLGLTSPLLNGSDAKTAIAVEIPDNGSFRKIKPKPTTTITFGAALIVGFEAKFEISKR